MSVQLRGLSYVDHPFHSGQGTYVVIGWVADHIAHKGAGRGGEKRKTTRNCSSSVWNLKGEPAYPSELVLCWATSGMHVQMQMQVQVR